MESLLVIAVVVAAGVVLIAVVVLAVRASRRMQQRGEAAWVALVERHGLQRAVDTTGLGTSKTVGVIDGLPVELRTGWEGGADPDPFLYCSAPAAGSAWSGSMQALPEAVQHTLARARAVPARPPDKNMSLSLEDGRVQFKWLLVVESVDQLDAAIAVVRSACAPP